MATKEATNIEKTMVAGKAEFLTTSLQSDGIEKNNVVWSSSDPNVATVNPHSGLLVAQDEGTAVITATLQEDGAVAQTYSLTVTPRVSVSVFPSSTNLIVGQTTTLEAINFQTDNLVWLSCNRSVATVDEESGEVRATGVGSTEIWVHPWGNELTTAYCSIRVDAASVKEPTKNTSSTNKVADPIDAYTGAHLIDQTLFSLFGGQNIKLTAHYDSEHLTEGALGYGWYHNYEKYIKFEEDEVRVYSNPSLYSVYTPNEDDNTILTCENVQKSGYVLTIDHTRQYPYIVDCNSIQTECYDSEYRLAKIINHQGFETLITYSDNTITITDCITNKKMYLVKSSCGKITRIQDDTSRQVKLCYEDDFLSEIRDANGKISKYCYHEDGKIKCGTDANGIRYFENTYDDSGRVIAQRDGVPGTHNTSFEYDGEKRITTNRLGKQSIREYTDGLLSKYTDEKGNVKTYVYDENYNLKEEIDANGKSVVKIYNEDYNRLTDITDKNGKTTHFEYDTAGNVVEITYPAIDGTTPKETFVYNARNQMTQHTDIRGAVTVYTYDENGMPATKKVEDRDPIRYTYVNGFLMSQTDAEGNTTSYTYNNIGLLVSKTDADNNVTQYEYDANGNLTCVIDANNNRIETTYDGNYQKTSVTDANGNITQYTYNGNMKNTVTTLPDGNTVHCVYDLEDRLISMTDQENNSTLFTYDDIGRLICKQLADGSSIQYDYDAVGNVVTEINPNGAIISKTYDGMGNILSVTDDQNNTTTYEYNAMSKVTKIINPWGGTTTFTYSPAGDLLSETDAWEKVKTYTYDKFGNRLTATDPKGNVTSYTYDANNNLLTVKDALNHVTTYSYNCLNQCISVKDAANNEIRYGYDALGRRTTVTDARGNVFTTFYDNNGNVVKTTDANGVVISETVYNSLNKPLTVIDAMGKTTTYTYNALGNVASVTDSLNHRTEFSYDSLGRNTAVLDAANGTSTATYDYLGNVTRLAGPLGGATTYTYDNMGRLTSESTVSGGSKSYEYNALNVRSKVTNARNIPHQIDYDIKGRIVNYTSPKGVLNYTYDANDNVLTVAIGDDTITRSYDELNRVTSYTDTYGKTIGYEYNSIGKLSKLTYPDNTSVTYEYDANHNLIKVTDWKNRVTTYTYDANNRLTGITKPDGSVTTTVYDTKQRVTSTVTETAGGVIITGFEYVYDDLSRVVEEKRLDKNTKFCYTYDNLNRVTSRIAKKLDDNSVISTETFSYDAAGNIIGGSADDTFVYDTNNRLMSFNGNAVSYDLDGNMLSNGSLSCTYDSENKLTSAGGHTYTYNAEDVRIRNLCADADTTYTYDTNCQLSKLLCKTTNGIVTKYVYGRGLIGEEKYRQFKTYHFDSRGSTVAITDESGNVTDTFAYDTYGKLISRTGSNFVIFGYNGRDGVVTDKNGLIYMRARYYSPEMKRFINADIVKGKLTNAITLNRFAYANGNPVSFVDPFGLSPERGKSEAENTVNYIQAVLVSNFDANNRGLPFLGHTQLYFLGDNNKWYMTDFFPEDFNGVKAKKNSAIIHWDEDVASPFNNSNSNYVILTGNFNTSVALAKQYAKEDPHGNNKYFGKYNFLFNNCSDYTNEILEAGNIDGMFSQVLGKVNGPISIPAVRELLFSATSYIDSFPDTVISMGENLKNSDTVLGEIAGNFLVDTGAFIGSATNFVGDVAGNVIGIADAVVDDTKKAISVITNAIVDACSAIVNGAASIWNRLFS